MNHLDTLLLITAADTPASLEDRIKWLKRRNPEGRPWSDDYVICTGEPEACRMPGERSEFTVTFDSDLSVLMAELATRYGTEPALKEAVWAAGECLDHVCDAYDDPHDFPFSSDLFRHHEGERWWAEEGGLVQMFISEPNGTGSTVLDRELVVRHIMSPIQPMSPWQRFIAPVRKFMGLVPHV